MNARILGSWLVWEDGLGIHTLDSDAINHTEYLPPQLNIWYASYEWRVSIKGDDAAFFHNWWMARLEEEEKIRRKIEENERRWLEEETHN